MLAPESGYSRTPGAGGQEKAVWIQVAEAYVREVSAATGNGELHLLPIAKVVEGGQSSAFLKALGA
jgi:gelsolin